MSKTQSSYHPLPEDRALARLLDKTTSGNLGDGANHTLNSLSPDADPLIPFLDAYKKSANAKISADAGSNVWDYIDSTIRETREATVTPIRLSPSQLFLRIAAVLFLIAISGLLLRYSVLQTTPDSFSATSERIEHVLNDNSTVVLRPNSNLTKISERSYHLDGEAYFDVQHNDEIPFTIHTASSIVLVTGTSFTVRSDSGFDRVFVQSGSVRVTSSVTNEEQNLTPGTFAEIQNGSFTVRGDQADSRIFTSWLRDEIYLENRTVADITNELSRHFNVEIVLPEAVMSEQLQGILTLDNPQHILEDIALTLNLSVHQPEPNVFILD